MSYRKVGRSALILALSALSLQAAGDDGTASAMAIVVPVVQIAIILLAAVKWPRSDALLARFLLPAVAFAAAWCVFVMTPLDQLPRRVPADYQELTSMGVFFGVLLLLPLLVVAAVMFHGLWAPRSAGTAPLDAAGSDEATPVRRTRIQTLRQDRMAQAAGSSLDTAPR